MSGKAQFRFSFGPWNIHDGADVFGPPVRRRLDFAQKLKLYKKMGFDGCSSTTMTRWPAWRSRTPR